MGDNEGYFWGHPYQGGTLGRGRLNRHNDCGTAYMYMCVYIISIYIYINIYENHTDINLFINLDSLQRREIPVWYALATHGYIAWPAYRPQNGIRLNQKEKKPGDR